MRPSTRHSKATVWSLGFEPFSMAQSRGSYVYTLLVSGPETCPRYSHSTQMPRSCRTPAAASSASCCSVESSTRFAMLLLHSCKLRSRLGPKRFDRHGLWHTQKQCSSMTLAALKCRCNHATMKSTAQTCAAEAHMQTVGTCRQVCCCIDASYTHLPRTETDKVSRSRGFKETDAC